MLQALALRKEYDGNVALDNLKKALAYIPEIVMLYKNLTGLENLKYFSTLAGHKDYTDAELIGFLRQAGWPDGAPHRRVGGYSKGMRQKVGIAIALAKSKRWSRGHYRSTRRSVNESGDGERERCYPDHRSDQPHEIPRVPRVQFRSQRVVVCALPKVHESSG